MLRLTRPTMATIDLAEHFLQALPSRSLAKGPLRPCGIMWTAPVGIWKPSWSCWVNLPPAKDILSYTVTSYFCVCARQAAEASPPTPAPITTALGFSLIGAPQE